MLSKLYFGEFFHEHNQSGGIDLAKNVFQVYVWLTDNSVAWNKKVSRQKLLDTLQTFQPIPSLR
ncbi:hypothetical protein KKI90_01250 [Xenorhabdus bovienii]|nr:hypothetical protein [Xenorhabdus bovienii]MDE9475952.1 hypothetical protein [Xenorhabdus bovienii]